MSGELSSPGGVTWITPVHGVLSAFPLAFFTGALITDVVYVNSTAMQWANFSAWQITFGLFGGAAAAIVGLVDAAVNRNAPMRSWLYGLATLIVLLLALWNIFIHSRDAWTSVMPTGLTLSIITTVVALATAWLGQSLAARKVAP